MMRVTPASYPKVLLTHPNPAMALKTGGAILSLCIIISRSVSDPFPGRTCLLLWISLHHSSPLAPFSIFSLATQETLGLAACSAEQNKYYNKYYYIGDVHILHMGHSKTLNSNFFSCFFLMTNVN